MCCRVQACHLHCRLMPSHQPQQDTVVCHHQIPMSTWRPLLLLWPPWLLLPPHLRPLALYLNCSELSSLGRIQLPSIVSHCIYCISCTCRNIVCTVNLGCKLDLKKIALHARNAEYNPKRFAAVIMRIRDPRTTALIFSSGKMVCTGAKR